jgi:hypothetical protein
MRNTRTLRLGTAVLGAFAILATGAASAGAHDGDPHDDGHHDEQHDAEVIGYEEAALNDAQLIAERNGYRVGTALEFVEQSRVFADFTAELAERYRRSFAAAVWAEDPGDAALIRFKGEVPDEVVKHARELGLEVEFDGTARYSADEMHRYTGKVHDLLLEYGWDQVVTAATPEQTISATVFAKDGAELPRLPRDVEVDVAREPIGEDHHSRGGGNVLNSTNARICTSGFTVEKNGVHGVATSGHCDTMDKYQEPDTGTLYETDFEDSHYGFWGDYQWQSSPTHVDPAEYFARVGEIREVNSISNWLPVNTPTCSFGRTTLVRNCDEVYNNFVIATFSGPTHWFLMANDNNFSAPGDSGGPISWATEADGLNKGSMTLGGSRRQIWVRGSLMPIAIGATIRTQ